MAKVLDLASLEVNIPTDNFGKYCTSLAAPPKWGKTSWATKYPKPFILDFEEGSAGKVVFRVPVERWIEVKQYIRQLVKSPDLKQKFETIVLDTVNYALDACKQYVMNEYQSNNPDRFIDTFNKIPWGAGWELLIKEFTGEINKLKRAGYGVVLISHTKNKQFEKDTESAHSKTVPDLTDKERNMINAMADFMLLGEFETEIIEPAEFNGDGKVVKNAVIETNRVLYLRTNKQAEAGFRWEDCPEKIPMDFNLFQKIFKEALLKEIEKGKEKYNLDDSKINKIRENLDKLEKEQREQMIKQEQEKEREEKTKKALKQTVKNILLLSKELLNSKEYTKEEIVNILEGDPTKIKDINKAESILNNLKRMQEATNK